MNPNYWCFHNGDIVQYSNLNLHVSDLGLQRGYGVFDFFRIRKGKLPWIDDYTERLFKSAALADIELKLTKAEFTLIIHTLHEKNNVKNGAFKVIVTGGLSDNLAAVTGDPSILILNVPWKRPPQESYDNGVQLLSYNYSRPEPEIKTLYYFHTLHLRKKMKEIGAIDLLFHHEQVYEASRANIFAVKNGDIFTPGEGMLFGVTRKQVLSLFPGIKEAPIYYDELYDYDELFVSSTSRDITPIVGVDNRKIGNGKPGPFTREVQHAFQRTWS